LRRDRGYDRTFFAKQRRKRILGARTMLLAVRSLAKNLRTVPGRKMLVLFFRGFRVDAGERIGADGTIDACNKANVAIYSLDVRGLKSGAATAAVEAARGTERAPGTRCRATRGIQG